ncbi:MAG: hypothetical protein CM1200mP39_02080 [Dehalococcoidia bacterium]|nr:MAG: hypothetical protein CM1200mP39_02080 [Dehalococcoidia bacterium]
MGLNKALGEFLDEMGEVDPLVENMHIKARDVRILWAAPYSKHWLPWCGYERSGGQVPAYECFLVADLPNRAGPKLVSV